MAKIEDLNKIRKLMKDAQARIDAGKTTPSDIPHIERGRWCYGSKEQRTINLCKGEIERLERKTGI